MAEISFKDLPLYSYDYDSDFPPAARAFKEALALVDAVLFVTPEYNRSIPGGLKNAIDWASRAVRSAWLRQKNRTIIRSWSMKASDVMVSTVITGRSGYQYSGGR
jgi:chromate reductase, NAD(P)H dehydrogenase (quinone)